MSNAAGIDTNRAMLLRNAGAIAIKPPAFANSGCLTLRSDPAGSIIVAIVRKCWSQLKQPDAQPKILKPSVGSERIEGRPH
jgi:hypothetical protein